MEVSSEKERRKVPDLRIIDHLCKASVFSGCIQLTDDEYERMDKTSGKTDRN